MSHIVWLEAYNLEKFGDIEYTEEWINENVSEPIQHMEPEGKLLLGYGDALRFIYRGLEGITKPKVITSDQEDIFGPPEELKDVILYSWDRWHKKHWDLPGTKYEWDWRWETIHDFFTRYGEYGYVIVVTVY